MKKKLKLEILDPTGVVVRTHHFFYEAGEGNRLRLTICDNEFPILNKDGVMIKPVDDRPLFALDNSGSFVKDKEPRLGVDEQWANEFKARTNDDDIVNLGEGLDTKHTYAFNKETGKTQKLFCEEMLMPVWTVKYDDPNTGNKGEAVYYTVSAKDEQEAKTLALACNDFNKYILPEHYDARYLSAYKPSGNYKIGEVQYFEGDPRL